MYVCDKCGFEWDVGPRGVNSYGLDGKWVDVPFDVLPVFENMEEK
jgi:hypothetical protein